MKTSFSPLIFLRRTALALALCPALFCGAASAFGQTLTPTPKTAALWKPKLLFGTVNFNDQLAKNPDQWRRGAARMDGMLLHLHFFVRQMSAPGAQKVEGAEATIRQLAPMLQNKANVIELTYHIRDTTSSPEAIALDHARQIERMEKEFGIPIAGVNVDWILSGLAVQMTETPRQPTESDDAYFTRILKGVLAKSARYVAAFRAAGRGEALIAVFPPLYVDEGPWTNARSEVRPGITTSRILNGLFDLGFDGFTADSPFFILANPAYRTAGYYDALRSIEWTCKQRGKAFGFIVNGNNSEDGAAYDARFAKTSLEALDLVRAAGLRPDAIILESWYKGPFNLVPETQSDTLTGTFLSIAQKLDESANSQNTPVKP